MSDTVITYRPLPRVPAGLPRLTIVAQAKHVAPERPSHRFYEGRACRDAMIATHGSMWDVKSPKHRMPGYAS